MSLLSVFLASCGTARTEPSVWVPASMTYQTLRDLSEWIVVAEALDPDDASDPTVATLRVLESMKGDLAEGRIIDVDCGENRGESIVYTSQGYRPLETGARVLLFLKSETENGFLLTAGIHGGLTSREEAFDSPGGFLIFAAIEYWADGLTEAQKRAFLTAVPATTIVDFADSETVLIETPYGTLAVEYRYGEPSGTEWLWIHGTQWMSRERIFSMP